MVREGVQVANRHDRRASAARCTPANHSRVCRRNRAKPLPPSHPTLLRASVDGYTARSRIDFSRLTRMLYVPPAVGLCFGRAVRTPPARRPRRCFRRRLECPAPFRAGGPTDDQVVRRAQATALKPLAKTVEGSLLVLKSTEGNIAKALVTFGFRKGPEKPVVVLMIDRFVAYGPATGDTSVAVARNVMLFPGFEFDIDLGQVVPAGFGGDVKFGADGALTTTGGTTLVAVDGPPAPEADAVENLGPLRESGASKGMAAGRGRGSWLSTRRGPSPAPGDRTTRKARIPSRDGWGRNRTVRDSKSPWPTRNKPSTRSCGQPRPTP